MAADTFETFGPYRLDALIGRGGMGEVYRAVDLTKNRVVALKRLQAHLAADEGFQARFRREAEMAARLREPHVIPIHDYGEIDGRLFVDMRLVEGGDLAQLLATHGALSPDRAVGIVTQVAAALDAAHADGLVHRDVKPSNVLISAGPEQGADHAYLVDFGIAHSTTATRLTATGSTIGTVDYIAPERFLSDQWDHRVDVYALGCLLSEALTGQKAFPVDGVQAQMFAHVHTPPPQPARLRTGIEPALDSVVAIAMAKDPAHRYRSAGELAAAARAALAPTGAAAPVPPARGTQPVTAPGTPPPAARRPRGRHRKRTGVVVVLAGVLLTVELVYGASGTPEPAPAPIAAAEVERDIARVEQESTGRAPESVTCPVDLPAADDATIECTLTNGGRTFGVDVTVTSVQDGFVDYDIAVDALPS